MDPKFFLTLMILTSIGLVITNFMLLFIHPVHSLTSILLIGLLITFSILYGKLKSNQCYNPDPSYRNAYDSGDLVAGTVYASNPNNTPGLGWVL